MFYFCLWFKLSAKEKLMSKGDTCALRSMRKYPLKNREYICIISWEILLGAFLRIMPCTIVPPTYDPDLCPATSLCCRIVNLKKNFSTGHRSRSTNTSKTSAPPRLAITLFTFGSKRLMPRDRRFACK